MTKRDKYYQLLDQYVSGNLSTQERHDLEKKALDDPFFFDAMEGWVKMGNADHATHLDRLQKKINRKGQSELARKIIWPIAIAASLLLLFTIGNILTQDNDQSLAAVTPEEVEDTPDDDSSSEIRNTEMDFSASDLALAEEEPTERNENEIEIAPPSKSEKPLSQEPAAKETESSVLVLQDKIKKPTNVANDAAVTINQEEIAMPDEPGKDIVMSGENEMKPASGIKTDLLKRQSISGTRGLKNSEEIQNSTAVGVIEILDSELDIHIKQSLFMRALKVPPGQRFAYDLTFDSDLTLKDIKIVSETNKLSESIKEFIEGYKSWKKETIPPNLFGRFNFPPK